MNKTGTIVTGIKTNFHYNAAAKENGSALNINSVNNFYFHIGSTAGDVEPTRMTKDTSITKPSRMTKDTSITQPDRMTKDTSITDRTAQMADESENMVAGVVNNFYWNSGFSGTVENNFFFGKDESDPAGKANDTRPSRAANPGQSTGDPAELPDVPNVNHQHIK